MLAVVSFDCSDIPFYKHRHGCTVKTAVRGGSPFLRVAMREPSAGEFAPRSQARLRRLCAGCESVLLPEGFKCAGLPVFSPVRLPLTAAFLCAVSTLPSHPVPPVKRRVSLVDLDALLPDLLCRLMPLAGVVRIVTRRPDEYLPAARKIMEDFGAALLFSSDTSCVSDSDAVIASSAASIGRTGRAWIFTGDGSGTHHLSPYQLPDTYLPLCPSKTDPFLFACALNEHCEVDSSLLI